MKKSRIIHWKATDRKTSYTFQITNKAVLYTHEITGLIKLTTHNYVPFRSLGIKLQPSTTITKIRPTALDDILSATKSGAKQHSKSTLTLIYMYVQ